MVHLQFLDDQCLHQTTLFWRFSWAANIPTDQMHLHGHAPFFLSTSFTLLSQFHVEHCNGSIPCGLQSYARCIQICSSHTVTHRKRTKIHYPMSWNAKLSLQMQVVTMLCTILKQCHSSWNRMEKIHTWGHLPQQQLDPYPITSTISERVSSASCFVFSFAFPAHPS